MSRLIKNADTSAAVWAVSEQPLDNLSSTCAILIINLFITDMGNSTVGYSRTLVISIETIV